MNKERDKRIKLLKALSDEQLIDELRRRRNAGPEYKLAWLHKDAFYQGLEEQAEAIAKEAQKEAEKQAKGTETPEPNKEKGEAQEKTPDK